MWTVFGLADTHSGGKEVIYLTWLVLVSFIIPSWSTLIREQRKMSLFSRDFIQDMAKSLVSADSTQGAAVKPCHAASSARGMWDSPAVLHPRHHLLCNESPTKLYSSMELKFVLLPVFYYEWDTCWTCQSNTRWSLKFRSPTSPLNQTLHTVLESQSYDMAWGPWTQSFGGGSGLSFSSMPQRFDQDLGLGPGAWPGMGVLPRGDKEERTGGPSQRSS